MSAGFHYDVNPAFEQEEICDVRTLHHKAGAYKLDTTGLAIGSRLPRFTPVQVDLTKRTCVVVKNAKVLEDAEADATTVKIAKNSLVVEGMTLGTGSKGAVVKSIDKTNPDYDILTLTAAFGEKVKAGQVLFEASAAGGTKPKNTANFVIYETTKIDDSIVLVALIMQAYEIHESKLVLPFSDADKAALTSRFQFED